jgi:hypothetical protein
MLPASAAVGHDADTFGCVPAGSGWHRPAQARLDTCLHDLVQSFQCCCGGLAGSDIRGGCHASGKKDGRTYCQRPFLIEQCVPEFVQQCVGGLPLAGRHHLGNLAEATACYERALSLQRESGARKDEAEILTHLGDVRQAAGELPQAREAWQQALVILDELHHAGADQVRAKLAGA